jgi:hypothetical protein
VATPTNAVGTPSAVSLGGTRRRSSSWWLYGLASVGCLNLIVLLAQAPSLVHGLYMNADNATAFVLPALASHAPSGSIINLGNHPWYEPWWLMRATVGLPGYRFLWEAAPFLFGLLGIASVSACAWWALGRLAGLLCGVALLASGEALRGVLYVPESHGAIVLHLGVLCGALLVVYRTTLKTPVRPATLLLVSVPLVVFTGAGFTDQLLIVSGLGPFMLAPLICRLRYRSQAWQTVSDFALVTGLLSAVLAVLLTHLMQRQHVVHSAFPVTFVSAKAILAGLQNLLVTIISLGGGAFFGKPVSGANLLTLILGALTLLAFAALLRVLWRWSNSTSKPSEPVSEKAGSRELFIAFWGLVLVVVLAAFALTSVSESTSNGRYLVGAWTAMAALLGILATTPRARTAIVVAVSLFGVLNVRAELASGVTTANPGPSKGMASAIERFATAHGASIGYGGYWNAAPVTWETGLRVKLYPIESCSTTTGLCPFYAADINTWYSPRAHIRTFLLTDARGDSPIDVTIPPKSVGRPLARKYLGEGLTIYIYDHDIASDLSR